MAIYYCVVSLVNVYLINAMLIESSIKTSAKICRANIDKQTKFLFLARMNRADVGFLFTKEMRSYGYTVYPKKYAHGFCFAVLCCGYTLTDFPISIRLTSPALWQSNDCPSASKATLMNMDKYFMWIHYERLHNHNKAKHNKTVCIFLGIYCRDIHYKHSTVWRSSQV